VRGRHDGGRRKTLNGLAGKGGWARWLSARITASSTHHGLSKSGGGRQYAGVVGEEGVRRDLLLTPQLSLKRQSQRAAGVALVSNGQTNPKVLERVSHLVKAAAWKADVLGEILGTGDDARPVVRGEPHGLRLVELRILERSQSQQRFRRAGLSPSLAI
jgi:hypothetical protein